ncbi:class I SAM-dependent methyltransferase [Patescibacteria group bacterium]|nr:class I SAM-dependent methyltransferase [Patescibacteria group bacterium]MBU1721762.1 class I SAM-dependent methyltransferase [Patescibacteria group bacterium]MBU1901399.1 class I SAM-dependent methyltransferase [Patescibacteria group bacterium]
MKNYNEQNKSVYNKISAIFAQTRGYVWHDIAPLISYTHDGDTVLDLGCGTGRLYQLFQEFQGEKGVSYIGVDHSEGQIEVAKKQYPQANFQVGDMLAISLADNTVDIVYSIAAFHHLSTEETRLQALAEMKRVLRPGGIIAMTNWFLDSTYARNKLSSGKWHYGETKKDVIIPWRNADGSVVGERYYHAFDMDEMEDLLARTGFSVVEQYLSEPAPESNDTEGKNFITVARLNT